jgi:hypothetical protein
MKCSKCEKEVDVDSKFCSNCGEKIEEDSILSMNEKAMTMSRRMWYIVGFLRGKGVTKNKKKKWYKEYEDMIKEKMPEMYKDYEDTVKFWKDIAEEQDEKNKKETNGLKRVSISKTERVQKQK